MGIAKNGPHGDHTGRIGNVVYYVLNGKNVSREIGITTKPPTKLQLKARMEIKLSSQFLSRILDFLKMGFGQEALGTDKNAYNLAVKYNKKNMLKGIYPNLEIAYDQLILSKGTLKPVENWQVTQAETGLLFQWETNPQMAWPESTDQAMMLAYFPKQGKAIYTLFGDNRLVGSAMLEIPPSLRGQYVETYMSFIAADRKQVSDSTYTGSFNQEDPELLKLDS